MIIDLWPSTRESRLPYLEAAVEAVEDAPAPFTLNDIWRSVGPDWRAHHAAEQVLRELERHGLIVRVSGVARTRRWRVSS